MSYFLKFLDGLNPTTFDGDFSEFRKEYLLSKIKILFFNSSYSLSDTNGLLSS